MHLFYNLTLNSFLLTYLQYCYETLELKCTQRLKGRTFQGLAQLPHWGAHGPLREGLYPSITTSQSFLGKLTNQIFYETQHNVFNTYWKQEVLHFNILVYAIFNITNNDTHTLKK